MINLVQAFAETYRDVDPGVSVQVAGGGSGVGIAGLIVPLAAVTGYLVVKAWPALSWELVTRNPSRFNLVSIAIRYRLRSRAKW